MNFNILSFVKEQLSGYVIGKMSDFLGENPYKTASALENVLPVVLGGLVNKSANTQGAGLMMDQIKDAGHDGKVFDNLNDIVKDPDAMLDWLSSGSTLSNKIFGDKINSIIDGISGENDIRKTSAASLLSFLSPLVLGAVGKHITTNSLGISGIIDLMVDNRSVAVQSLTPDMKYSLGLENQINTSENTIDKPLVNAATHAANTKKSTSSNGSLKWILPLFLVGLLAGLAYYFLKKKSEDANISFFDKWAKKDTSITPSTVEGDSLKLKLEQRLKNTELSNKAKTLSKSSSEKTTTSNGTSSSSLLSSTEKSSTIENKSKVTKKETNNTISFSNSTPVKSKSRSNSSTSFSKQSHSNRMGNDIIEDLDSPSSSNYSTRVYTQNNINSSNDLSSAIRNRSLNTEFILNGISFVNGGYEFTGSSKTELNKLANLLKSHPRARVFIQAYATEGSSQDQNLSQMRAEWVRYALIDRGVKPSNIETNGHGNSEQTSFGNIARNKVSMKLIGI